MPTPSPPVRHLPAHQASGDRDAMREDRGMKASRLARGITPEQLAELLAISWFDLSAGESRCPTMRPEPDSPLFAPLIANRILTPRPMKGWNPRKWRLLVITDLGKLTLLFRVENDLRDAGKLPPDREPDDEE